MPEPAFLEERRARPRSRPTRPSPSRPGGARASGPRACASSSSTRWRPSATTRSTSCRRSCGEHLGDEEHAGLIVQRGASVIFAHCDDPSVTVTSLEQAVEETPELVEPWLGTQAARRRGQVRRRQRGLLDRRRVHPRPEEHPAREADPGRLPDRRARHGAVRAHPGGDRRARRVPASASTASGPTSRARRCTPAPSSCTPARAPRWTWPTTRTGAAARSTTSRSSGWRSRATPA